MQLENEVWQKIAGTSDTWIYPLIRKPSITGSNTFIIRSGKNLLVIDPGAIVDQWEKTREILAKEVSDSGPPIILIAGHIHIDHVYRGLTDRGLHHLGKVLIAAESGGAHHLEDGSLYWTGADAVGIPLPRIHVDLCLFSPEDRADGTIRRVPVDNSEDIILTTRFFEHDSNWYYGQSMPLAGSDMIEFWHSPGHCDDSITIRIGSFFHIGDIPFAINPGIAGRPGYDRDSLIYSIIGIRHLFEHENGLICCPGHGRALNREAALAMFERLESDARAMPEISLFDVKRLDLSMWHGLDLVEEAYRLFPIIAGRIMFLSYQLEELGMTEEADMVRSLFDYEAVDCLLDDLTLFYDDYKVGKKIKPEVVCKILQVFERIQSSFPVSSLAEFIDLSLIRRVDRLFSDFLGTIHGVIPKGSPEEILILPLMKGCISDPSSVGSSDSELILVSDDDVEFRKALLRRLAHYPHQRKLTCSLLNPESVALVRIRIDLERFRDFFSGLCEYFETIQVQNLDILFTVESDSLHIRFTPQGNAIRYDLSMPGATLREAEYAGGKVISVMEPGKEDIRVLFPVIS